MAKRVIIVGAGLAGLAASAALTDQGFHTILIEQRSLMGGRATSFHDRATSGLLDNCQHILLGCCTNLLHLYRRFGVADQIEFFNTLHFADQSGRRGDLYSSALPSPLHLSASMLQFDLLTLAEKFEIARAMGAMKLTGHEGRAAAANITFETWLRDHGQSPQTIKRFWNLILVSALNANASRLSAKYAMQVFQDAFLGHRNAYRLGVPRVPLAELYTHAIASEIHLARRVDRLVETNGQIVGVTVNSSSEFLPADYVILATRPQSILPILGLLAARDPQFAQIEKLQFAPIIGVHFWYDRPVMNLPHLALMGTRLHWIFRKDDLGCQLHGVISDADDLVPLDQTTLTEKLDKEIRQALPTAGGATLLRSLIIKEKQATFLPSPGIDAIRPAQSTAIPGLFLAGDYTRTDWPATMEGAVRSGYLAAQAILRREGSPFTLLQPDL